MSKDAKTFWLVVTEHIEGIHGFAYRLTNSRAMADTVTREVFLRAYVGRGKLPADDQVFLWLLKIAVHVVSHLERGPRLTFELLDETIRGDPTQVTRTDTLTDPERQLLLWDLKQGCMTAVLGCLSEGERVAFVLAIMPGLKTASAAATLDITPAALKVRISRAKKKIVDYLAPRCEHVHPENPCRCPSRLGVALRKGFIQDLAGKEVSLRKVPAAALKPVVPLRDVVAIFQTLPAPAGVEATLRRIEQDLLSGGWDRLC